jgi:hypothetical protein
MTSCVFLTRKNQSPAAGPPEKVEFTGHAIGVAELRARVAKGRHLETQEVELTFAGRVQTDDCAPIERQSTVFVRRKPLVAATHTQKQLAAQTAAWARSRGATPATPAIPLSQQQQSSSSFGLGTFQQPGAATYAYPDSAAANPSVPRLPAPQPAQPQFPVRFPSEPQLQPDSTALSAAGG